MLSDVDRQKFIMCVCQRWPGNWNMRLGVGSCFLIKGQHHETTLRGTKAPLRYDIPAFSFNECMQCAPNLLFSCPIHLWLEYLIFLLLLISSTLIISWPENELDKEPFSVNTKKLDWNGPERGERVREGTYPASYLVCIISNAYWVGFLFFHLFLNSHGAQC